MVVTKKEIGRVVRELKDLGGMVQQVKDFSNELVEKDFGINGANNSDNNESVRQYAGNVSDESETLIDSLEKLIEDLESISSSIKGEGRNVISRTVFGEAANGKAKNGFDPDGDFNKSLYDYKSNEEEDAAWKVMHKIQKIAIEKAKKTLGLSNKDYKNAVDHDSFNDDWSDLDDEITEKYTANQLLEQVNSADGGEYATRLTEILENNM